jgi:hypothetical protein
MTRIWQAFARIPVSVTAALFVVGGALMPLHEVLIARMHAAGPGEWPQWIGYLTVKWYWAFLPLAALTLWARRRRQQGTLGRIGGWLHLVGGPVQYGVLLVGTLTWGLVLDRGDLPVSVMAVENLGYLVVPGLLVSGIAMLRDRGTPRWQGSLIIALAVAVWLPYGALVTGLVLGGLLVTKGRTAAAVLDSPDPVPAR